MRDVMFVGRNVQVSHEPMECVTTGDRARTGVFVGGICDTNIGMGLLILPGSGPVIVAGPLAAAQLCDMEGTGGGSRVGGSAGALFEWGVTGVYVVRYENHMKEMKVLILLV